MKFFQLLFIFAIISNILSKRDPSYRAAIGHIKGSSTDPTSIYYYYATVNEYISMINEAGSKKADFIVFPELGLEQTATKNLGEIVTVGDIPYLYQIGSEKAKWSPIQMALSKAAKDNNMYVIFDFVAQGRKCEVSEGDWCVMMNQFNSYNASLNMIVVFDNKGKIVQNYQKTSIFEGLENYLPGDGTPRSFEMTLRNGKKMTWGLLVCFDLLNQHPMQDFIEGGINHLLFPTQWDNVHQGFGDTGVFQGISGSYDLTIVAADVYIGAAGSGVFKNGQILSAYNAPQSKVIVVDVNDDSGEEPGNVIAYPGTNYWLPLTMFSFSSMESHVQQMIPHVPVEFKFENSLFSGKIKAEIDTPSSDYIKFYSGKSMGVFMTAFDSVGFVNCGSDSVCDEATAGNTISMTNFTKFSIEIEYEKKDISCLDNLFTYQTETNDLTAAYGTPFTFKKKYHGKKVTAKLSYKKPKESWLQQSLVTSHVYRVFPNPLWPGNPTGFCY